MQKFKAKLTAILMAISCFAVCLGIGVGTLITPSVSITANAETAVRTITKAGATKDSSATAIYAYTLEGEGAVSGDWNNKFIFVEDSGEGIKFNGETLDGYEMKQPGDVYVGLGGKTAAAGDEVIIDGEFYSSA